MKISFSKIALAVLSLAVGCAALVGAEKPRPWGVYPWGRSPDMRIPADMPVRGIPFTWRWEELEPARGKFNFDEAVRQRLEVVKARNGYTHIMFHVAPITPEWVYEAGVPKVIMPERITPARKLQKPTYPYYFDPLYKEILHELVTALSDYLAALPEDLKSRILFIQVAEGATGDGQPYKGVPLERKYVISEKAWNDYRRETWAYYQAAFQRADASLDVPLLVNGDANTDVENQWLLDHTKVFGVKQGMFSHGYLVSDTIDRLARWEEFRARAVATGHTMFTRGEQDEEWRVCGWSNQNPPRAFYWSGLFALHCKLDVWNVPIDALATQPIKEAVVTFNRYAGYNEPGGSPGAFCALRRGLDASDTKAYPESEFGEASKTNVERYLKIASAFAKFGARQGDPQKAIGGGMRNRQADDQNDVGWRILPGNFERHLFQLDPEQTSLGLWDTGPAKHPYGLFARRFDTASGRNRMSFKLADGFFAQPADAHGVRLRIVYLDDGKGGWELAYATRHGEQTARRVALEGSGLWREIVVTLPDAVWDHRLAGGADLSLRQSDGGDTTFHLIELERI
ncbi:MAG: hypothetical protein KBA71_04060 [Opitutaceae bacterium]|nr:hypothetical protein [Opitutaceae bacterium]